LFPDFLRRLWVDLARRYRRQSVTNEDHHVATPAALFFGFEWQALLAGFIAQLGNEFALVHCRGVAAYRRYSDKNVRTSKCDDCCGVG
jgi:hypothetical protein